MINQLPTGLDFLVAYITKSYPMTDDLELAIRQAREIETWGQTLDFSQN